jgi:hypothetical protein
MEFERPWTASACVVLGPREQAYRGKTWVLKVPGVESLVGSRRGGHYLEVSHGGVVPTWGLVNVGGQAPRWLSRSFRGLGDLTWDCRSPEVPNQMKARPAVGGWGQSDASRRWQRPGVKAPGLKDRNPRSEPCGFASLLGEAVGFAYFPGAAEFPIVATMCSYRLLVPIIATIYFINDDRSHYCVTTMT